MSLFQHAIRGMFYITTAVFTIYIFSLFIKPSKSGNWILWYNTIPQKEQKKYDPVILLNRIQRILLLISIVGAVGLVLSIFVNEFLKIPATILIFAILIISIPYTSLRHALIDKYK